MCIASPLEISSVLATDYCILSTISEGYAYRATFQGICGRNDHRKMHWYPIPLDGFVFCKTRDEDWVREVAVKGIIYKYGSVTLWLQRMLSEVTVCLRTVIRSRFARVMFIHPGTWIATATIRKLG